MLDYCRCQQMSAQPQKQWLVALYFRNSKAPVALGQIILSNLKADAVPNFCTAGKYLNVQGSCGF